MFVASGGEGGEGREEGRERQRQRETERKTERERQRQRERASLSSTPADIAMHSHAV